MKQYVTVFFLLGSLLIPAGCSGENDKIRGGSNIDQPAKDNAEIDVGSNAVPQPPTSDASEPKRIIRYFCKEWKDENYKAMYGAMTSEYREQISLESFKALFASDKESNGGLQDENIAKAEEPLGASIGLNVALSYRSVRARPKTVVAVVIKTPKGYRIAKSGIVPIDLNNL